MEKFHWSLTDIDNSDMEFFIQFALYYPQWQTKNKTGAATKRQYADEAGWL